MHYQVSDAGGHRMDKEQKKTDYGYLKDGQLQERFAAAAFNEEDIPAAGEDIPFSGDDIPYTGEDGFVTLMEDIEHAIFMHESGFSGEAEEDLRYIMEKLENGRCNVDDETVR